MKQRVMVLTILIFLSIAHSYSETIKNIEISGNERIPDETIKMFSGVQINEDINQQNLNEILKSLYESNFFKNVSGHHHKNRCNSKTVRAINFCRTFLEF